MKATEAKFIEFLKRSPQFVIPIYQRTYSWTERECRQLWEDILRTGSNDAIAAHFVGSIVYIEQGLYQVITPPTLLVIDGQQRLTTVMLMLEALARRVGDAQPVDGFSAKKLRNYYLLNPLEEGERGFKLLLTQTDKQSLLALMQQQPQPAEPSLRITENFAFFEEQVQAVGADLTALCKGIAKLMIVDIALSRDQDNPQLIFESMNSTGRALSQADLIRNFILMGLAPPQQTRLYEVHWRPMEVAFGQEAYGTHFDDFMRHYLTLKTGGTIPNVRAVYEAFKGHARSSRDGSSRHGRPRLLTSIPTLGYYCAMALDKEPDKDLRAGRSQDLRALKVDVVFPFLLEIYDDYKQGRAPEGGRRRERSGLVEAYVFRRAVCAIPTNSLNKTFATFGRVLQKGPLPSKASKRISSPCRPIDAFPATKSSSASCLCATSTTSRVGATGYADWRTTAAKSVRRWTITLSSTSCRRTRTFPRCGARRLAQSGSACRKPGCTPSATSRSPATTPSTATGRSERSAICKVASRRARSGSTRVSAPWILGTKPPSKMRAKRLAEQAVQVWTPPSLLPEVLEAYRSKAARPAGYTLDDHAQLADGSPIRSLFEEFRKEVLALDPCVSEEILKLYVAYKAETNFVDVVPQQSRLRLSLNMRFHELHDPKELAKDVTNLGRWGNGDVEVSLSETEDMPYIMGLVRQAFEKQMGNGEAEA